MELLNYKMQPGRKCDARWISIDMPKKKNIMSTAEFAEASGFPLRLIRDYCRDGLITCWRHGDKKFLIDFDAAMADLENLTVRRHRNVKHKINAEVTVKVDKQEAFLSAMKEFK